MPNVMSRLLQRLLQLLSLLLSSLLPAALAAAADVRELSRDCEIALALSAAPLHLRDAAGVYVLGDDGYEPVRKPANGFACLVERNHRDSVIPQCFDAASFDANLAVVLDEGKRVRGAATFEEIAAGRREALDSGRYPTARHGVVYMISDFNYIYDHGSDTLLDVEPHLMFHAPNLTAADVGADGPAALANRGLPTLNAQGPHGFMITFVERPSDSGAVRAACSGQLVTSDALTVFPPRP